MSRAIIYFGIVLLGIFFSFFSEAQILSEAWEKEWLLQNPYQVSTPLNDGFVESAMNRCFTNSYVKKEKPFDQRKELLVSQEGVFENMPVSLLLQKDSATQNFKQAPMVLLLPGIFADVESPYIRYMTDLFYKKGFHVLSLNNPWNQNFIASSQDSMGNLNAEGKIIYDVLKKIRLIYRKQIGPIHLVGTSYGAFLGSVVSALDKTEDKILSGKKLFVSPPKNMTTSMIVVEQYIKEDLNTKADGVIALLSDFKELCKEDWKSYDLNTRRGVEKWEKFRSNVKHLVVHFAFHKGFIESMEAFNKKTSSLQDLFGENWKKSLLFSDYFGAFQPALASDRFDENEQLDLNYYLNQLAPQEFRVLTSKNDFINVEKNWAEAMHPSVYLMPQGGHMGFMGDTMMTEFLENFYK